MTCAHPTVWVLTPDARWPVASPLASAIGPVWCPECGAFRGADGTWRLPESARVRVTVAPPSPHRIQSTGERPVFPEFLPEC